MKIFKKIIPLCLALSLFLASCPILNAEITEVIPEYTGDPLDKNTMTPDEFDVAAQAQVDYLNALAPALNTWATQANAVAASANDIAVAIASANYKGLWSNVFSGAGTQGDCYRHNGSFWLLNYNIASIPASEPDDHNVDWSLLPIGTSIVAATTNYAISQGSLSSGVITFTNEGAAGAVAFTLPARAGSYKAAFLVVAGQYLRLNPPSGEKLYFYNNQETAVDGYIRSNTVRTYFEVIGTATLGYTIVNLVGDLKVDE